jgi:outer membrane protein TolC
MHSLKSVSRKLVVGALALGLAGSGRAAPPSSASGAAPSSQPPAPNTYNPSPGASEPEEAEAPSAASGEVPAQLGLQPALQLAIEHSATLRQSATGVANARSRLVSTAELRQHSLEADTTGRMSTRGRDTMLGTVGSLFSRDFRGGGGLSLSGTLPWMDSGSDEGGQAGLEFALPLMRGRGKSSEKQVAIDQAALAFDQERLRYFMDRQNLLEQVARAYFSAVRARERIAVQQQAVSIAQQATDDAQKRLDAGLITEIDLTRAKLQLSSTRETLLNQEADYRNALDRLVLLLGLPVGATPELTDPVPEMPVAAASAEPSAPTTDLDAALREALANRPELKLREMQEEDARIATRVAKDQKRPRADLTTNLSALGLSLLTGSGVGRVLTSVMGLRLSVPVNKTVLRENEATTERNLATLARMREFDRQEIVEEVRSLVRAQETARSNIDLLTENLKVAEQSLRLAQRLIEEGLADNRNLLDAQSALTATRSSLLSARIDYYLTTVSLTRALGRDMMRHFNLTAREPLLVRAEPKDSSRKW